MTSPSTNYSQQPPAQSFSQGDNSSPNENLVPRLRLSCEECSRRKIRCDKKIPCRACCERGEASSCRRQQGHGTRSRPPRNEPGHRSVNVNVVQHGVLEKLESVFERLDMIESVLGLQRAQGSSTVSDDEREVKENGLVSAMEEAALGIGENRRWKGASLVVDSDQQLPEPNHQWFNPTSLSSCLTTLPGPSQSKFLVQSYFENVNWMTGCLHRGSFQQQHDEFWSLYDKGQPPDGMPLALLFAVLSNAAFFLDEQIARAQGYDPQRLLHFARQWFDCSIATFFRSGGITHFSLAACQTIMTLRYAYHLTGNSSTHQQLSYVAIGVARAMNLHLLRSNHSGSEADRLRREMGRRVWWLMVEGDWDLLPYHRYCFISAQSFNTDLPDLTDEGILASSTNEPHSLTFLLACCQSSRVLYEVYSPLSSSQHPHYETVVSASQRLERIVQGLPSAVRQAAESSASSSGPVYVWRFLVMMLAYRSYMIHRSFFVKSLSDPRYGASRVACTQAAETIISLADKGLPSVFYRLWNTTLWLVAAGLVLGVDLAYATSEKRSYPDAEARRRRLAALVDLLSTSADRSGIGARGASLIRHICAMEQGTQAGSPAKIHITRDDILDAIQIPNASQIPSASRSTEVPIAYSDIAPGQYNESAGVGQSRDHSTSVEFASPPAVQPTGIGFDFAESSLFIPQWGDRESYGAFGLSQDPSQLDALFADMLPDPSIG
ncbi:c6 zinc finger domain-containing protein [Fusarium coicis]|nr:c6 zinc finger domain-containing protein [Fusarium coicis]